MKCCWCQKRITEKDIIGINKKLLSENTPDYYCLDCMAEYFGCETRDILDKIEQFKQEGCVLFG